MSLRARRILYVIAFAIFFSVAPLLIYYTAGYRFNFKKGKIEKTGILIIESVPKKADIYLSKEKRSEKTPARIIDLLPNKYEIEVVKEGYGLWKKNLAVNPGMATFVQNVALFKNKIIPQKILDLPKEGAADFKYSTDKSKIAFLTFRDSWYEVWIYDFESGNSSMVFKNNFTNTLNVKLLDFNSDSSKIIIKQGVQNKEYIVVDINENKGIRLAGITSLDFTRLKWVEKNVIYATSNNALYAIDLSKSAIETIDNDISGEFLIEDDNVYYFQNRKEDVFFAMKKRGASAINKIYAINPRENYLISSAGEYKILLDKLNQNIRIFRGYRLLLKDKAKNYRWSEEGKKFIYWSDSEINIFYPQSNDREVVTRYGQQIGEVLWYSNLEYVIYTLDNNSINIIELDQRDLRNNYHLMDMEKISGVYLHDEGKKIYFYGKNLEGSGLWEAQIQ